MNFRFPEFSATPLKTLIPNCGSDALQLITDTLKYDPAKRPTCKQVLEYSYFNVTCFIFFAIQCSHNVDV